MTDINRNEAWKVESTGIDRVPDAEQTGKPIELFWIWSAANIGILGVVYGAIIVGFGLSFLQSVLAALVGVASFVLVGLTSFAGKRGRTSTLTLAGDFRPEGQRGAHPVQLDQPDGLGSGQCDHRHPDAGGAVRGLRVG